MDRGKRKVPDNWQIKYSGKLPEASGKVSQTKFVLAEYAVRDSTGIARRHAVAREVAAAMKKARSCKFRKLGPVSSEFPNSQSSFYTELETEESELQRMKNELKKMQMRVATVEDNQKRQTRINRKHSLFLGDSYALSIRAFSDFVLDAVFSAAKIRTLNAKDRANWLMGSEAKKFFADKEGDPIPLLEGNLIVNQDLLEKVRALRRLSSKLSETQVHRTTAVKVALALQEAHVIKGFQNVINVSDLNSVFEDIFKLSPEVLVEQWKKRTVNEKFEASFGSQKVNTNDKFEKEK